MSAAEIDENTFVTSGLFDYTLMVWNKTTCECLRSIETSAVLCMIRTKNKLRIACGEYDGVVEMRRISDLYVVSSFKVHSCGVLSICELEDGSFVSGSNDETIKRWNDNGEVLQTLYVDSTTARVVLELQSDIIAAVYRNSEVAIWRVSTGQILSRLSHGYCTQEVVRLSRDNLVTASYLLQVWNWKSGGYIETISKADITAMIRRGDYIITTNRYKMEVRRLKYARFPFSSPSRI